VYRPLAASKVRTKQHDIVLRLYSLYIFDKLLPKIRERPLTCVGETAFMAEKTTLAVLLYSFRQQAIITEKL